MRTCYPRKSFRRDVSFNNNNNNNNNNKTTTTLQRQYNFIILIKGTFKLLPGPTSCKEIHDKDT